MTPIHKLPTRPFSRLVHLVLWPALGTALLLLGGILWLDLRGEQHASIPPTISRGGQANVVIFLIDTLRADHLGVYGYERPTSPEIDSLARESVVFDRAYAPAPWTLPSVVSMMTSTYPCEHGVIAEDSRLSKELDPLAVHMREMGYRTASFYATPYSGLGWGMNRGFEVHERITHISEERVADWLGEVGDEPFFLYIHAVEPHDPYYAPPELMEPFGVVTQERRKSLVPKFRQFRRLTRVDWVNERPLGTTDNTAEQRRLMQELSRARQDIVNMYDSAIRLADLRLGYALDALRKAGVWDETLFILVSDHGEEFGEHGGWQHDQSVYKELIRVPMVVRFPGSEAARYRPPHPVSLLDIVPTVADYLGAGFEGQGQSLLELLPVDTMPDGSEVSISTVRINRKKYYRPFEEERGDLNVALHKGRWKAIWNAELHSLELYDLARDPGERSDVAGRRPEMAQELGRLAGRWVRECLARSVVPWGADPEAERSRHEGLDEETIERLKALGYL